MIPEPKLNHMYQEVILDHNRNPRNFKEITNPTLYSHGKNPLCGDDYHLYLLIDDHGIIQDVGFRGAGCAISKSSASMMTQFVKGKTVDDAVHLKNDFIEFMTQDPVQGPVKERVGRLKIFEGVREFPVRVKCATLIWHTLADALKDAHLRNAASGICPMDSSKIPTINGELTPNPNTVKFRIGKELLEKGTCEFGNAETAEKSALAKRLFNVRSIQGVLIGKDFVTVTKNNNADWQALINPVVDALRDFFVSDEPVIDPSVPVSSLQPKEEPGANGETEQKIKEILDREIRPAVQRDGGDITFYGFHDGIVQLHLQGSCSSCPSSIMTLKMGIESRLKQVLPEVREVVQV